MIPKLGIITALPTEANCLSDNSFPTKKITSINNMLIMVSGIGSENAALAAQQLINHGATALVSWGTAGGLSKDLQSGDILLPEFVQLHDEDDQQFQTDQNWRQRLIDQPGIDLKLHGGLLLQTNKVISSTDQKSQLHQRTAAIAVDMESGSIGRIADQNNLPFLIIRSVVDSSDETIPVSAINSIDEFGRTRPAVLTTNLIKNPGDIPKLIKLGKHFQQARKSLKKISTLVAPSLASLQK